MSMCICYESFSAVFFLSMVVLQMGLIRLEGDVPLKTGG
jgi:hypothetical protein